MKNFKDFMNNISLNEIKNSLGSSDSSFSNLIAFFNKASVITIGDIQYTKTNIEDFLEAYKFLENMNNEELEMYYKSLLEKPSLMGRSSVKTATFLLINYYYRTAGNIEKDVLGKII